MVRTSCIFSAVSESIFSEVMLFWCSYNKCFTFCLYTLISTCVRTRMQNVTGYNIAPTSGIRPCRHSHLMPLFHLLHLSVLVP